MFNVNSSSRHKNIQNAEFLMSQSVHAHNVTAVTMGVYNTLDQRFQASANRSDI